MRTFRRLAAAVLAAMLALSATACSDDDNGDDNGGGDESSGATGTSEEEEGEDSNGLTITASDFQFSPSTLEVPAGEATTIALRSTGDAPHTFTIDDTDVDESLEPGGDGEAEVTVSTGETLTFFCRFHREGGMEGTITAAG